MEVAIFFFLWEALLCVILFSILTLNLKAIIPPNSLHCDNTKISWYLLLWEKRRDEITPLFYLVSADVYHSFGLIFFSLQWEATWALWLRLAIILPETEDWGRKITVNSRLAWTAYLHVSKATEWHQSKKKKNEEL